MTTATITDKPLSDAVRRLLFPSFRDLVIARRPARADELSGRRTLVRAGFTTVTGGAIITLTSMAFGPRFFASDVRAFGIFIGLLIMGLGATAPVDSHSRKLSAGVTVMACAIVAFPVAAGGYFIGSIVAVIGGSLLIAYEPATEVFQVRVERAGWIRRLTAVVVDLVAAFVLHRAIHAFVPELFDSTLNVMLIWALCWSVAVVIPMMVIHRTPGRTLMVLRLVQPNSGERVPRLPALKRELLRGLLAIASFVLTLRLVLGSELRLGLLFLVAIALATSVALIERFRVMERLTDAVSAYDAIVALALPAFEQRALERPTIDLRALEPGPIRSIDLTSEPTVATHVASRARSTDRG